MSTRVYIGHLSSRATERDVENFFRSFGRIRDVILKNGFGFVEFDDARDAEDAVYDLNGRDLCGERVIVEISRRGTSRFGGDTYGRGGAGYGGGRTGGYGVGRDGAGPRNSRYGPPVQTRYRMVVENLSTRCSWQDLKDMIRNANVEVTYADAHKKERNVAVVCFASHDDLKKAMDKYQGKDINGRRIKLIDETQGVRNSSRSPRSRSRSRSPRPRSRSPMANGGGRGRSRSRSYSGTRSRSTSANGN